MPPSLLLRAETSNNPKFISLFEHIFLTTRLHHLYLSVVCGACAHVRVSVCVCFCVQMLTIFCALCSQTWIPTTPGPKDGKTYMPTVGRKKEFKATSADSSALETQQERKST